MIVSYAIQNGSKEADDLDPSTDIEDEKQLERNELVEDVFQ